MKAKNALLIAVIALTVIVCGVIPLASYLSYQSQTKATTSANAITLRIDR